jgi:hypothetical protein
MQTFIPVTEIPVTPAINVVQLKRATHTLPAQEDGILMASEILNVVIDERKKLDGIDSTALMRMGRGFVAGQSSQRRVFKDYILSSEVFYVDNSLN